MILRKLRATLNIICIASFTAYSSCTNTMGHIAIAEHTHVALPTQEPVVVPTDTTQEVFAGLKNQRSVARFYQQFGTVPVWIDQKDDRNLSDTLMALINSAHYYGLAAGRYHGAELASMSKVQTVRKELLLTDAFLSFAADVKFGLLDSKKKSNDDSVRLVLLKDVVTNGSLKRKLEALEPGFAPYESLKTALREQLESHNKYTNDSASVNEKVRLISINLERWRREVVLLADRHIYINIPSFMLEVIDADSVVLSSRIVVGKPETQTPVLSSVVECFTIYPYWHVPRKISVEEYLPILKRDTTFLRRNNFDVLDRKGKVLNPDSVAWEKFNTNYFPVVLRQGEGTENSLGVIKFIFDNPHAVFLHDTNAKRLFSSTARAFSHGCIRMERAVELAHYLVTGSVTVESKTISKYLKEKQQRWIDVKRPIPIYTRYFTCDYVNGVLRMYKDIYGADQALYDLLYAPEMEWGL
ncbi:MAG TPA: L,D-transpeptidase family protein [Chryseosolibacter sp.]